MLRHISHSFCYGPHGCAPLKEASLCIYKADALGDFVLACGVIRLLIRSLGAKGTTLIVSAASAEVARQQFPEANVVLALNAFGGKQHGEPFRGFFTQRRLFGETQYESLVCLRHDRYPQQSLVNSWIRAQRSFGVKNRRHRLRDPFQESVLLYPGDSPQGAELECHRVVAAGALRRQVMPAEVQPVLTGLSTSENGSILVSPFASMPIKEIDPAVWVEVLKAFPDQHFNICVARSARNRALGLAACLQQQGLKSEVSTPSLTGFFEAAAKAKLVLTVDTATSHIATALNKKVVTLLGGGHFGRFGPWGNPSRQVWLSHKLGCFHCDWHCTQASNLCVSGIPTRTIISAMRELLCE